MHVTLAMVISLDGKTTKASVADSGDWASPEDQTVFRELIASHDMVVMGSATYKTVRERLRPNTKNPRVILTRTPEKYADDVRPGLTFTNDSPEELIARARKDDQSVLLVGGSQTNARFFDAGMIDELFVTIEPHLFGTGLPFTAALQHPCALTLLSVKQLNEAGTLLLHYRVTK